MKTNYIIGGIADGFGLVAGFVLTVAVGFAAFVLAVLAGLV